MQVAKQPGGSDNALGAVNGKRLAAQNIRPSRAHLVGGNFAGCLQLVQRHTEVVKAFVVAGIERLLNFVQGLFYAFALLAGSNKGISQLARLFADALRLVRCRLHGEVVFPHEIGLRLGADFRVLHGLFVLFDLSRQPGDFGSRIGNPLANFWQIGQYGDKGKVLEQRQRPHQGLHPCCDQPHGLCAGLRKRGLGAGRQPRSSRHRCIGRSRLRPRGRHHLVACGNLLPGSRHLILCRCSVSGSGRHPRICGSGIASRGRALHVCGGGCARIPCHFKKMLRHAQGLVTGPCLARHEKGICHLRQIIGQS